MTNHLASRDNPNTHFYKAQDRCPDAFTAHHQGCPHRANGNLNQAQAENQ
jgi:hypothetical protein